jgi:hypothetical protein
LPGEIVSVLVQNVNGSVCSGGAPSIITFSIRL